MSETACRVCGKEGHREGECTEVEQTGDQPKVLTPERLKQISSFESEVHADFDPLLATVNQRLGLNLVKRPDGFHATIIGPAEFGVVKTMPSEKIVELEKLNEEIQRGEGVVIRGVGFVDGATLNVRDADKSKRAAFIALDVPKLQAFRTSVGLPPKDFHVTLGFENADLHMQIVGTNEKGKPVLGPVEKKADPKFDDLISMIEASGMRFGSLSGVVREQPKEKPAQEPKSEQKPSVAYDVAALRGRLEGINSLTPDDRDRLVVAAASGSEALVPVMKELGAKLRADTRLVRDALAQSVAK